MTNHGNRAKWTRVRPSASVTRRLLPGTRVFQKDLADGHLSVMVGREPDDEGEFSWHLSISHRTNDDPPKPGRYPTWDEISEARYRFIPDEAMVVMFLPPRAEYVDVHATTFHLWEVSR